MGGPERTAINSPNFREPPPTSSSGDDFNIDASSNDARPSVTPHGFYRFHDEPEFFEVPEDNAGIEDTIRDPDADVVFQRENVPADPWNDEAGPRPGKLG